MTAQQIIASVDSLTPRTAFNQSSKPVLDRNGSPFTPGCRVRFELPSYYINTFADEGVLASGFDRYGGFTILADHEHNVHDRNGFIVCRRREVYATSRYHYHGPFAGNNVTASELGDPFEHGVTKTFVEIID